MLKPLFLTSARRAEVRVGADRAPAARRDAVMMRAITPGRPAVSKPRRTTFRKEDPMRSHLLLWSLVAAALVSLALVGAASALEVGQKAPDFALNAVER